MSLVAVDSQMLVICCCSVSYTRSPLYELTVCTASLQFLMA